MGVFAVAAYGDDGGAAAELTITAPEGTAELVPGGTSEIAWEVTGRRRSCSR
jgi:hypothetical protein